MPPIPEPLPGAGHRRAAHGRGSQVFERLSFSGADVHAQAEAIRQFITRNIVGRIAEVAARDELMQMKAASHAATSSPRTACRRTCSASCPKTSAVSTPSAKPRRCSGISSSAPSPWRSSRPRPREGAARWWGSMSLGFRGRRRRDNARIGACPRQTELSSSALFKGIAYNYIHAVAQKNQRVVPNYY